MFTLHAHSNYSLLSGTIRIEELVTFAKKHGSHYVALTDTNGMSGLIKFVKLCLEQNIKPILGSLVDDPKDKKFYAVFIAKNNEGYAQLCRIITTRKLKEDFSLIDLFSESLNNLYVITSSIELLKSIKFSQELKQNIFVELIVTQKAKPKTRELYEYAKENNLQVVASHPAYFVNKEDFKLHQVVTAIRLNGVIDNIPIESLEDEEYYLMKPEEFNQTWKGLPEAVWNADRIAHNCQVDLKLGEYKFPVYQLQEKEETPFSYLWKIAFQGLARRYQPLTEQAIKKLQYELEVIDELGYSEYFLIVWDIIREAKARGIMHLGRGSAANSLVSYCLGFTEVDPIEQNLYFERFLNRGRASPPDIDLDFSWRERDSIIKYIFDKYGYDKVAMISTTVTFRARSAFREVAKVFGLSNMEISEYSKYIPWSTAEGLPSIVAKFPQTKSIDITIDPWKSILKYSSKLSEFPHYLSIHPSGIIITKNKLTDYAALEYAKNKGLGLIVTQPDMYSIEDIGLVKIDILSQRSLGVLKETMKILNEFGEDEEEENLNVYKLK
jgi:DNA polymerase III alpha subunit